MNIPSGKAEPLHPRSGTGYAPRPKRLKCGEMIKRAIGAKANVTNGINIPFGCW